MTRDDTIRIDFVCVHNAGRSQMAAAIAERECTKRGLEADIEIHSGGTEPADSVHDEVVQAMNEVGIDIADRTPKYVDNLDQLKQSRYLITMGCSISKFNPNHYGVESKSWDLTNPDEQDMEMVREVRDEIEAMVQTLFDEIETTVEEERRESDSATGVVNTIRNALSF